MSVFNQEITVVNLVNGIFRKKVLKNCSWHSKIIKNVENGQLKINRYYSVTILFQEGYDDIWYLNPNNNTDLLVLGKLEEEVTEENYQKILNRENVGIISEVVDNTIQDKLKHWKVICF